MRAKSVRIEDSHGTRTYRLGCARHSGSRGWEVECIDEQGRVATLAHWQREGIESGKVIFTSGRRYTYFT